MLCGCVEEQGEIKYEFPERVGIVSYISPYPKEGYVPHSKLYDYCLQTDTMYFYEVKPIQIGGSGAVLLLGNNQVSLIYDDEFFEITKYEEMGLAEYYLKTKSKTGETILSAVDEGGANPAKKFATSLKIYVY